jgi:hypothetical protein
MLTATVPTTVLAAAPFDSPVEVPPAATAETCLAYTILRSTGMNRGRPSAQ